MINAAFFSDFLDMDEHLLDNGYKDHFAPVLGAVLKHGLRRIQSNNNITVKSNHNMGSLNKHSLTKECIIG